MKKLSTEQLKIFKYILGYWVAFVLVPSILAIVLYNYLLHYYNNFLDYVPAYLMGFVLFIAPFLYYVPYRLAKPKSNFQFIFWGLIFPYLFIYLSIYLSIHIGMRGFGGGIG